MSLHRIFEKKKYFFRTKQRICVAKEEKFDNETLLCETAEDSGIWEGSL